MRENSHSIEMTSTEMKDFYLDTCKENKRFLPLNASGEVDIEQLEFLLELQLDIEMIYQKDYGFFANWSPLSVKDIDRFVQSKFKKPFDEFIFLEQ